MAVNWIANLALPSILIIRAHFCAYGLKNFILIKSPFLFQVKWTKDTHEEADFGKENILRKSSRFLVLEKMPCSDSSPRDVLVELAIVASKDAVPPDFTAIERTLDTRMLLTLMGPRLFSQIVLCTI